MLLSVVTRCPEGKHEFPPFTAGWAFVSLCACERSVLTGANGIVRVEVLG